PTGARPVAPGRHPTGFVVWRVGCLPIPADPGVRPGVAVTGLDAGMPLSWGYWRWPADRLDRTRRPFEAVARLSATATIVGDRQRPGCSRSTLVRTRASVAPHVCRRWRVPR